MEDTKTQTQEQIQADAGLKEEIQAEPATLSEADLENVAGGHSYLENRTNTANPGKGR